MNKPLVRVPSNLDGPAFTIDGMMSDGLVNFVSRIGTGSDKSSHGFYGVGSWDTWDLDPAYRTSWFRKINDIPPFDEVREWRTWTGAEKDQITLIDKEEKRLNLRQKVAEARTRARKDGGSAIILGAGGNAATPLDPTTIKASGLKYINVCSMFDITPGERDNDPTSEFFNQPKRYFLRSSVRTEIHPSRVIRFIGNPFRMNGFWNGWGESIWVELRDAIKHADQIAAGVAALVDEAKTDVFRIDGFMAGLATAEYENRLVTRWSAINTAKSAVNAILLDKLDEYDQKELTFAGLPDIQDRALMIMSGMADIPATRLLGRAPQGMNSTGDSDMRNYYDRIRAGQIMFLTPALASLDECLVRSAIGSKPDEIYYEWNPLYTMSEQEAATVEKTMMETITGYVGAALIPDTAAIAIVRDGIVERGQMPGADLAFKAAESENDLPGLLAEPTEAELAAEQAKTAVALATAADPTGMGSVKPKLVAANDRRFTDATPRTLYVRRDVVNVAEIRKWALAQGFTDIVDDMHVTVIYSTTPVDWMKMGESWQAKIEVPPGGPRLMETFGKFQVLAFASSELKWRNQAARDAGASFDFEEYQPHISISKTDMMPSGVKPYQGKIVLSEEIFEEVRAD